LKLYIDFKVSSVGLDLVQNIKTFMTGGTKISAN